MSEYPSEPPEVMGSPAPSTESVEVKPLAKIITVNWPAILDEDPRRLAEQILDQWAAADWDQRPTVEEFTRQLKEEIAALREYIERITSIVTQISSVI